MTKKFYLRIEGTNLSQFVEDTQDISTIRGGSLLLLDSIDWVKEKFHKYKFKAISTGASSGLFQLEASDGNTANSIRNEIEKYLNGEEYFNGEIYLNGDKKLKHATFVVDILETEDSGNFVTKREQLIALNRWRQMYSPSLAVPVQPALTPCAINRIRPASEPGPEHGTWISTSVSVRRKYGRANKKKAFYEKQTGLEGLPEFVNDFDELSDDRTQGNLHHKLAVLYLDGNKFGDKQNRLCTTACRQEKFDLDLKCYRKRLLRELLSKVKDKPAWLNQGSKGRLRIETLLWGGDELIWVVPAWAGLWTAAFFFERSEDWNFGGEPLTHAAGLVFCHHNASIHRITALARDLAGLAKDRNRKLDCEANRIAYQILESFDHAGLDLKDTRKKRCPHSVNQEELILDGNKLMSVFGFMPQVRDGFPRRRMQKVLKVLFTQRQTETSSEVAKEIEEILEDLDDATRKNLNDVCACLGGGNASWLHLADLWDYIRGKETWSQ